MSGRRNGDRAETKSLLRFGEQKQRHWPPPGPTPPGLRLSNFQVNSLMAWSNAEMFRRNYAIEPGHYAQINRESLVRHLMHAQLAADQAERYDASREEYILDWLAQHSGTSPARSELPA